MSASTGPAFDPAPPLVSVIVPTRNEVHHLEACVASVLAAIRPVQRWEILILDGESQDGTRELAERLAATSSNIRVLDNPDRITPAAFNRGIRAARADTLAIVSAHSTVDRGFFVAGLAALREGHTDIVGGPVETVPGGRGAIARLLAWVVSHPFGVGNSKFRVSRTRSYVDAVPFALFRREVFARVGTFDEGLPRNQDTEFFGRVARHGLRVLLDPAVSSRYVARGTVSGLLRQAFRNGFWNVRVWRDNPAAFRMRHAVPAAFVLALLLGVAAALVWRPARPVLDLFLGTYALAASLAAFHVAFRSRSILPLLLPPFFFLYHLVYGAGSIAGLRWFLAPRPTGAP